MKEEKIKGLYIKLAFLALMIGWLYHPTLSWLYGIYSAPDSYYSHGILIPLICAFLVWQKRLKLESIPISSSNTGMAIFIIAMILQVGSIILEVYLISAVSFLLMLAGLVLYLFGKKIFREIIFPYFFLLFMVPIPMSIINYVSFPMRSLATSSVVATLKTSGLPVMQKGFEIIFPRSTLLVDTPCSGMRSLITFLALGALFAYFLNASKKNKLVLFAMAFPVAFICNYLRILLLSFVTFVYGAKIATETFIHGFSGIMVFVLGFVFLMSLGRVLSEKS